MMVAEDCGTKHLKLAAVIVGIVIAVVSGAFGLTVSSLSANEERLRAVEQQSVRIEERLIAIQKTLNRIEGNR